jgi:hypothetical protein
MQKWGKKTWQKKQAQKFGKKSLKVFTLLCLIVCCQFLSLGVSPATDLERKFFGKLKEMAAKS